MNDNLYIDFHVIQTVPPSCVNRDDTGSPKTAMYGGTMRARVSSQAWKRAMRQMFRDLFLSDYLGYRTKNVSELVAEKIAADYEDIDGKEAKAAADEVLEVAGVKSGSEKKDALFFVSGPEKIPPARKSGSDSQDTGTEFPSPAGSGPSQWP